MPGGRGLRSALLGLVAVAAIVLVVVPLLAMLRTVAVEGSGLPGDILTSPGLGVAVRNSLALGLASTVLAVPIGTLLALALRRPNLPGRRVWQAGVLLPVLVPDFVLGYSWLQAYGPAGFIDQVIGVQWAGVQGPLGVVSVIVANAVPLAYLITTVGLAARAEPAAERAARASGANPLTVLATITVPLLRPAIATAAAVIFVLTLAAFAIPQVLGAPAGFTTITTRIYGNLAGSSDPLAFVGRPIAGRWISTGIAGYLILSMGLPLLALVTTAVTRAVGLPPTPANWTLDNFRSVLTLRNGEALGRSLLLAAVAATILVLLGGCVAALERGPAGRVGSALVTLTLVLPGSTLAVGLLLAYGRWLGDTLGIILLAYLAKLWAIAHRPVSGALDRLPVDELHAARISGAAAITAVRTVVLRPLLPALLAGWVICFLTALHEVTMSSLLYGPGNETLAVVVLNSGELGQVGNTAALSVLLMGVLLVPALGFWLVLRRLARPPHARPASPQLAHVG